MHRSRLATIVIDCQTAELDRAAAFWSAALGARARALPDPDDANYRELGVDEEQARILVQAVDHASRVHLDIETDDIEAEVRRLEALGATRVAQVRRWWVLQAPTGQRFCVVPPQRPDFEAKAIRWPDAPADRRVVAPDRGSPPPGRMDAERAAPARSRAPVPAGLLLGIGLGGMLDGIVLHQILQWHGMLSARLPPTTMDAMRVNMFADGVFHAATWIVALLGVVLLARGRRAGAAWDARRLWGSAVLGWGLFNVVEGLIDHHLLGLHHVIESMAQPWRADVAFLAFGAVLIGLGIVLLRGGGARRADRA
jgi:uncharacterized membrane protein/predicted enzyme related to lactoylglutathione lyase